MPLLNAIEIVNYKNINAYTLVTTFTNLLTHFVEGILPNENLQEVGWL
jgi:hypothetical protein